MGGFASLYRITYNIGCALGWGYIGFLLVNLYQADGSFANGDKVHYAIWPTLRVVQTAAILEIFHSLIGMVRSPIVPVFLQVSSRLICIWITLYNSPAAQDHWSLALMVGSWSVVEVPRYLFYAANEITKGGTENVWFPLFWIRYSAFILLYPSGITGEMVQMLVSFPYFISEFDNPKNKLIAFIYRFIGILFVSYFFLGPFMILNMWSNRKRAFQKRNSSNSTSNTSRTPVKGIVWPVTNKITGARSTMYTNQAIFAASLKGLDDYLGDLILHEKNWRKNYIKYMYVLFFFLNKKIDFFSLTSESHALQIAKQGLEAAHKLFQFQPEHTAEMESVSFAEVMKTDALKNNQIFLTGNIIGQQDKPKHFGLEIPCMFSLLLKKDIFHSKFCT
eukprot:GSMAST32.ASY1.ANO1.1530.1 assembled CDS